MTTPGQYAADDGSFARSAGGAAGRGLVLIAIAVAIGIFLLAKGFDGSDTSVAASSSGGDSSADSPADEPAADEPAADEPAADDGTDTGTDDGTGGDSSDGGTTVPAPDEPTTTNPPGEVKVAAVNATGEPGLAGTAAGILDTQGYVTAAKNATNIPTEVSTIYYRAGYSEDAKAVASVLGVPADVILPAPDDVLSLVANGDNVADFNIFVIQGTDRLAG